MLKYEYENATVYITKPTKKHIKNIKKATETFMKKVLKEQIQNENRRHNRGASINDSHAGGRDKTFERKTDSH